MMVSGKVRHLAKNPDSGANDVVSFSGEIRAWDPDAIWEYGTNCGCPPEGIY